MRQTILLLILACAAMQAQVSLTTLASPYTQDFNTLANTGSSAALPAGWLLLETGTSGSVNQQYTAGTGSSNAGDAYSFGVAAAADRAFGGLQSGTLVPTLGAAFTNSTGSTITSLAIAYTGEMWRLGTSARAVPDRLDFQFSLNATSLSSGTWTDVNNLDFVQPLINGTVGALDGNTAANRASITFTITGLSIASGSTFFIRWNSFDATGADDGLAIDDFSITPGGSAGGTPSLTINDVTVTEGNSGVVNAVFTVSLSSPAISAVTFNIATADGTAVAGSDYAAQSLAAQTIGIGNSSYSFSVAVNGDGLVEANETFFVNVSNITGATAGDTQGQGTIANDDVAPPTLTAISVIQGSGIQSSINGQVVTAQGVVTALTSNGYFLQTPDAAVDADPGTSEGVFVFTSTNPAVAVGNLVNATGAVTEFRPSADPNSRPITEITQTSVNIVTASVSLPAATPMPAPTAAGGIDQLERFEGMRVQVTSLIAVTPTAGNVNEPLATGSSNGVLYAVFPGAALPMREAGIEALDLPANPATACAAGAGCALPVFDANPERIRIDTDGVTGQNPLDVNTGAALANIVGVLHYAFRAYTILPTQAISVGGTQIAATAAPQPAANSVTIAAMNVERLFDTVDDPGVGDVVVQAAAFNGRLAKISKTIRDLLRSPDVVALEEADNINAVQSLAAKVNADALAAGEPNPNYAGFLVEGNDVGGIDVGYIVKGSVTVASVTQLGAALTYASPCTGAQETLNDRPTLRLRGSSAKGGNTLDFTVFVNHLRSLSGVSDTTPCALATDGARVRGKRAAQANYVARLVQDELNANAAAKIVVVGDFNAFEVNDGYADTINTILGTPAPPTQVLAATVDPGYANMTNLLSLLQRAQQYSYVFDGNHQTLDHAILNPAALAQLVGGGYVRVNADFNESFRGDFTRPERYSDHDPVYVSLTTAPNITAQVSVVRAGIVYNRAALTAASSVRVTNNTAGAMSGTMRLAITGLPDGVILTNASASSPAAAIYNLATPLAPGQTVTVPLAFSLSAIKAINYSAAVFLGGGAN